MPDSVCVKGVEKNPTCCFVPFGIHRKTTSFRPVVLGSLFFQFLKDFSLSELCSWIKATDCEKYAARLFFYQHPLPFATFKILMSSPLALVGLMWKLSERYSLDQLKFCGWYWCFGWKEKPLNKWKQCCVQWMQALDVDDNLQKLWALLNEVMLSYTEFMTIKCTVIWKMLPCDNLDYSWFMRLPHLAYQMPNRRTKEFILWYYSPSIPPSQSHYSFTLQN